MILFQQDWLRFPSAIVDYRTPNKTFLRQAQVYKSMGVKNHLFLLALLQPQLQGVDPFDPNLSEETKLCIAMECKYNPWYFFREVVRIPPDNVMLRANRGNIGLIWSFLNNIDAALIQPRQTGKSVSTDCLMVWLMYIGTERTTSLLLTKDDTLRQANIERLKAIRDRLPSYLVNMASDDANNQKELTCNALQNVYRTAVSQNSENAANNVGRGLTIATLHCDEGPFVNFIGISLQAALAAATTARDMAAASGRPYGNIFTTTAGKKDDRDGKFMYDMIHQSATWDERIFFDCRNKAHLCEMIDRNCAGRKRMVNITLSHKQLGYTDEWLYGKIADAASTGEAAERDYLNVWTSGSQRSPLTVQLNEIIRSSEKEVQYNEISRENYVLRWYIKEHEIEEYMANNHCVIGMDTSDAISRDAVSMVWTDVRTGAVVAAATYNETNLIRLARYTANLMIKYPNTTLVIERKSSAQTFIDTLLIELPKVGVDPFRRMFNKIVDNRSEAPKDYEEISRFHDSRTEAFYDTRKAAFGFMTTGQSRHLLYSSVLQNAAKKAGHVVNDKSLCNEILSLVEKRGKIDHDASGHDDMVIGWLLTHWFLTNARNLEHYGIDPARVMQAAVELGRSLTEDEIEEREAQAKLMDDIDDLLDELKDARDEVTVARMEHKLRFLTSKVKSGTGEDTSSLDAMIRSAAEERAKRMRIRSQQQRSGNAMGGSGIGYNPRGNRPINIANRPMFRRAA